MFHITALALEAPALIAHFGDEATFASWRLVCTVVFFTWNPVFLWSYTPLRYRDHRGARFKVRLCYPDGEHSTHLYSVFYGMPVSGLRYNISCLLCTASPVFLFVGSTWSALNHRGTITGRCFPGTSTPCPFLKPDSEVRVHLSSGFSASVVAIAPLPASQVVDSRLGLENTPAQISLSGLPLIVTHSYLEVVSRYDLEAAPVPVSACQWQKISGEAFAPFPGGRTLLHWMASSLFVTGTRHYS